MKSFIFLVFLVLLLPWVFSSDCGNLSCEIWGIGECPMDCFENTTSNASYEASGYNVLEEPVEIRVLNREEPRPLSSWAFKLIILIVFLLIILFIYLKLKKGSEFSGNDSNFKDSVKVVSD